MHQPTRVAVVDVDLAVGRPSQDKVLGRAAEARPDDEFALVVTRKLAHDRAVVEVDQQNLLRARRWSRQHLAPLRLRLQSPLHRLSGPYLRCMADNRVARIARDRDRRKLSRLDQFAACRKESTSASVHDL